MPDMLLCSNNPILARSLYSILRDEGYGVDTADYPSHAVQLAFKKRYSALIIDSEPFGLSVEDAVKIIKTVHPAIVVIFVGYEGLESDVLSIEAPIDLEQFRMTVHNITRAHTTH